MTVDMTRTGHSWRHIDPQTVACRHCDAEPWTRAGRALCPVTTSSAERQQEAMELHPSAQPLRADELHECDCGNPKCGVVYGLAYGWISALNDAIEHGAMPWPDLIDFVETKTREAWKARGL